MSSVEIRDATGDSLRRAPIAGEGQRLVLLLAMAGTMAVIVAVDRTAPASVAAVRYLAIVPVAVAAYTRHGVAAALAVAGFFIAPFLPGFVAAYDTLAFRQAASDLVMFAVILTLFAYLSATIAAAFRLQRSLASAVRGQEELLDRASDLQLVAAYVLDEARRSSDAADAALLLRSPIDERWEVITEDGRAALPTARQSSAPPPSVAAWLLEHRQAQVINDLEGDSRLTPPADRSGPSLRSLLAQPIRAADGTLVAMLVLINSEAGYFTRDDLDGLSGLVAGTEKALKQAGLYARTDRALARRARQLGALQRAARELNATLDPRHIIDQTLSCALEITAGAAGAAGARVEGFVPSHHAVGVDPGDEALRAYIRSATLLDRAILGPPEEAGPSLLPDARSRLVAPIRRDGRTYGAVAVESPRLEAFDAQDLLGLAALASHAATALENARLFADVSRERQKSDLIVETMADGLLTVDADGQVTGLNPAARRLLGERAANPPGGDLCTVLGCGRGPACRESCPLLEALRNGEVFRDERWSVRAHGNREHILSLSAAPMPGLDGTPGGLVVQLRDVTARAALDRFQRELIATFSHELRTPLTNITTIVSILLQGDRPALTGLSQDYLETLQRQARRLSEFAERILDVSRLDTGRWKLEARPLPVALLVEERLREWRTLFPSRAFQLELPQRRGWIWADEHAVGTVLDNLIDNAVKYSPAASEIVISVTDGSGGYQMFAVQDRGQGVAEEDRDHIFERFYRADGSDSQDVYGHGLGLYIARKLVDAMGGRIWLEGGNEAGSRFVFTLPAPSAIAPLDSPG